MTDIKWTKDRKWMAMAEQGATLFSTCGKRQYFAIVLSRTGRLIGSGYNGAAPGQKHCTDGGCPRYLQGSEPGSNYDNCVSLHAEQNALIYSNRDDRVGGTLYINGTPCYTCAKLLAGSGLGRVCYIQDPSYKDGERGIALMRDCGLGVEPI